MSNLKCKLFTVRATPRPRTKFRCLRMIWTREFRPREKLKPRKAPANWKICTTIGKYWKYFDWKLFVYSLNLQVRTQERLVEENCESSRENSLQETASPEAEFLILPWAVAADRTALWSPLMWKSPQNVKLSFGLLSLETNSWIPSKIFGLLKKKTYFQSDCKNGLQKQQQPSPTSRYQKIVNLHLSQNYSSTSCLN